MSAPFNVTSGTNLGEGLRGLLAAGDISTPAGIDYQLCKQIYILHPMGAKLADKPIELAQSQRREITVQGAGTAAEDVKERFEDTWKGQGFDGHAANALSLSRVYGASAIALLQKGVPNAKPLVLRDLHKTDFSINVYDPLNVAGSLVLNQNPLARDFLHVSEVAVSGEAFHRSRARVAFNENPFYIWYVPSSFGYTGRSVYQRPLLPLKSFITTMITDDMVARKSGVLVAKIKQAGSIVNQSIRTALGFKRNVVKEAEVNNVINIGIDEMIESLNLQNLEGPFTAARKNIIENIASGAGMPALLLNEETLGGSFHEGGEDAKVIARFIDRFREQKVDPIYDWLDPICMRLAWTEEYYEGLRRKHGLEDDFEVFFYRCVNSFRKRWPSLLKEPESEQVEVEKVKFEAIIKWVEVLLHNIPPEQRGEVIMWACDKFNSQSLLFGGGDLNLDYDAISAYEPQTQMSPQESGRLSFGQDSVADFQKGLLELLEKREREREKRLRVVR